MPIISEPRPLCHWLQLGDREAPRERNDGYKYYIIYLNLELTLIKQLWNFTSSDPTLLPTVNTTDRQKGGV